MKKPELLSPAGDMERLKYAFEYGADAVYIGGKILSMRAKSRNFTAAEMQEAVDYAHSRGKKLYVTVNASAHNDDFAGLDEYLAFLEKIKADAVLVSDLGVFSRAKKFALAIHISTQANITNYETAAFWQGLGARRVVLARELSLREIKEIDEKSPQIELETFVHGAMCMAYSGRCLISNFLNSRNANRGECSQPCRFNYTLTEERSGEVFPIHETQRGAFIMNSKDLCMAAHVPELVQAGVSCFKIEGRMRTEYYVGAVTKAYREAIDDFFADPELYKRRIPYYESELQKVGSRGYTTGFFFKKMDGNDHDYVGKNQATPQDFIGVVESYADGFCQIEQRNKFSKGDKIELVRAKGENFTQIVTEMYNEKGAEIDSAPHPKQRIRLRVDESVCRYDMVRKAANTADTAQ
ncbi:MAG: U32 family peptidase [Defluviitaleaceae bacterium]|nr:U32 family peptidase [Defluviitaleaceae bacterium]